MSRIARLRSPSVLLLVAVALVPLACDDGTDSSSASPEDVLREAKVGMAEAIAAAEAEVQGGVTVEAEFELGKQGAVFEVEILVGDEVREVAVDPQDGRVLAVGTDPEDLAEARQSAARLAGASLGLGEAVAIAERETDGIVFEIEVDEAGYELAVLADAGPLELVVSMSDGSILARGPGEAGPENEADEDEDEDEDDDDGDDD